MKENAGWYERGFFILDLVVIDGLPEWKTSLWNSEGQLGSAEDWKKEISGHKWGQWFAGSQRAGRWHCKIVAAWVQIWSLRDLSSLAESLISESRAWIKPTIKDWGLGLRQHSAIATLKSKVENQILRLLNTKWKWDKCKCEWTTTCKALILPSQDLQAQAKWPRQHALMVTMSDLCQMDVDHSLGVLSWEDT